MYDQLLQLSNDEVGIAPNGGVSVRLCVCAGVVTPLIFLGVFVPSIRGYDQSSHDFTAHVVALPGVHVCLYGCSHTTMIRFTSYTPTHGHDPYRAMDQTKVYQQLSQLTREDVTSHSSRHHG